MIRVASLFSQILSLFPRTEFQSAVKQHQAERYAKGTRLVLSGRVSTRGMHAEMINPDVLSLTTRAGVTTEAKNPIIPRYGEVPGVAAEHVRKTAIAALLEGGKMLHYGAKTIPEGGYYALPERLSGDGVLMLGMGIQSNTAALMRRGQFSDLEDIDRICSFHERQDRRYAEAM